MSILKSKSFWINVVVIVVMIIQYVESWPNNPENWFFAEGLALAVANYILTLLQTATVAKLKLENKTLKIQMQQIMNEPK